MARGKCSTEVPRRGQKAIAQGLNPGKPSHKAMRPEGAQEKDES
jgi:hypothetical protein